MRSVELALNLAVTNSDPEYWPIRARGLGLRNWVARCPADMDIFHRIAGVWVLDEKVVSKSGPIAMALTGLASLGWVIDADGTVDDGLGHPFQFWDSPRQEFLLRFDLAWNRTIEDRLQEKRKDFNPPIGQGPLSIDLAATRKLSARLSTRERGLIFFLQIGAQPTNLSRGKWVPD